MNKLLIQGSLQALILQSRGYLRNIKSARPSLQNQENQDGVASHQKLLLLSLVVQQ